MLYCSRLFHDPNRLLIVDMLSCEELYACVILEKFSTTQPTLSHHKMGAKMENGRATP